MDLLDQLLATADRHLTANDHHALFVTRTCIVEYTITLNAIRAAAEARQRVVEMLAVADDRLSAALDVPAAFRGALWGGR